MARYTATIDIWTLDDAERRRLQVGQWVSAGPLDATGSNRGRFYGQGFTTAVAWLGNARGRDYRNYMRALYQYGCAVSSRRCIADAFDRLNASQKD
jgi:hypothetical protein